MLPYPGLGGRTQVSTSGGSTPTWSQDGKELYFLSGGRLMAARVETRPAFRAGLPEPLFEATSAGSYDVAPDGTGFVMTRSDDPLGAGAALRPLSVIVGWFQDVSRRTQAAGN